VALYKIEKCSYKMIDFNSSKDIRMYIVLFRSG